MADGGGASAKAPRRPGAALPRRRGDEGLSALRPSKARFLAPMPFANSLPPVPVEPKIVRVDPHNRALLKFAPSDLDEAQAYQLLVDADLSAPVRTAREARARREAGLRGGLCAVGAGASRSWPRAVLREWQGCTWRLFRASRGEASRSALLSCGAWALVRAVQLRRDRARLRRLARGAGTVTGVRARGLHLGGGHRPRAGSTMARGPRSPRQNFVWLTPCLCARRLRPTPPAPARRCASSGGPSAPRAVPRA